MELAYKLTPQARTRKCDIGNRSLMKTVSTVYQKLDDRHKALLEQSCFGSLLDVREIQAKQLVHHLLMRVLIHKDNENEREKEKEKKKGRRKGKAIETENDELTDDAVWFKVGGKALRFGIEEFALVTGFMIGSDSHYDKTKGKESRLVTRYFANMKTINRKELMNVFGGIVDNETDRYKLGLIVILAYVLLGAEECRTMDWWWFELVDDLKSFNRYPWGSLAYHSTVRIFKRDMSSWFSEDVERIQYQLYGFPLAIMVWAFEAIPCVGKLCKLINKKAIPRMQKWELKKSLSSSNVEFTLQGRKLEIHPKLRPTELERQRLSYLNFSDEEESSPDIVVDDDSEFDEPHNSDQVGIDYEKMKEMIRVVVKEENREIYAAIEKLNSKLDFLVAQSSNQRNAENEEIVQSDDGGNDAKMEECDGGNDAKMEECDEETIVSKKRKLDEMDGKKVEPSEGRPMMDKGKDVIIDEDEKSAEGEKSKSEQEELVYIPDALPLKIRRGEKEITRRGSCERKPSVLKGRKLENVECFDPYREADPVVMDYVENVLKSVDDSVYVRLVDEEVKVFELKKVVEGGWLQSTVMNTALCQIRHRMIKYPHLFEEGAGVLDTYFTKFIHAEYENGISKKVKDHKFSKALIKYLNGDNPSYGKPWSVLKTLYVPAFESDHFFLLRIDLEKGQILVYDSMPSHVRKVVLNKFLTPFQVVIPSMLKRLVAGYEKYSLNKLIVQKVEGLPIQDNGNDCGMFVLKYVEFLTGKLDARSMQVNKMKYWRKKLVGELLAWDFDP